MPKFVVLGSLASGEKYEVLAMPRILDPELYVEDHEEAFKAAQKIFMPAIDESDFVLVYCPDGIGPHTKVDVEYAVKQGKPVFFACGKVSTFITEKKRLAEDDLVNIELESYRHRMLEEMGSVETMLHDSNIDAGRRGELESAWLWLRHYYIRAFPDKLMILKQMRQRYFPEEYE